MADCRKCIFFIPVEQMDDYTRARALRWINYRRPGQRLLGYCQVYNRPVTYYTGKCSAYRPKEPRSIPLDQFSQGD